MTDHTDTIHRERPTPVRPAAGDPATRREEPGHREVQGVPLLDVSGEYMDARSSIFVFRWR